METSIQASGSTDIAKAMAFIKQRMVSNMKETGRMMFLMVKVLQVSQTVQNIKETLKKEFDKVMVATYELMVTTTREHGSRATCTESGTAVGHKESKSIREAMSTTGYTGLEYSHMLVEITLKVIGTMERHKVT